MLTRAESIKNIFSGREAIEQLRSEVAEKNTYRSSLLNNSFEVVSLLAKGPLLVIYAVFAKVMSLMCFVCGANSWGRSWLITYKSIGYEVIEVFCKVHYGSRWLVRSKNVASRNTEIFLKCPPIQKALASEEVRALLYPTESQSDNLDLGNIDQGYCQGMASWFISLLCRISSYPGDFEKKLISIANLFKDGAPIEAQLIQKMLPQEKKCLGFQNIRGEPYGIVNIRK